MGATQSSSSKLQDSSISASSKCIANLKDPLKSFLLAFPIKSDLDAAALIALCQSHPKFSKSPYKQEMVVKNLLKHVFDGNPKKVVEYFARKDADISMILYKTCYKEGYESKKYKKFICFRAWKSVSPLQAAAVSLDNFLVKDLLAHIKGDPALLKTAGKQLQEILSRKPDLKTQATPSSVLKAPEPVSLEAMDEQELLRHIETTPKIRSQAIEQLIFRYTGRHTPKATAETSGSVTGMPTTTEPKNESKRVAEEESKEVVELKETKESKETAESKEIVESKEIKEKTASAYADILAYQAPITELLEAYEAYFRCYDTYDELHALDKEESWRNINNAWGKVGECHRRLPTYIKQEYFDADKVFRLSFVSRLFDKPPKREGCRYNDYSPLNLDELEQESLNAFYQYEYCPSLWSDRTQASVCLPGPARSPEERHRRRETRMMLQIHTLSAFRYLGIQRRSELETIVACLLKSEVTGTLAAAAIPKFPNTKP